MFVCYHLPMEWMDKAACKGRTKDMFPDPTVEKDQMYVYLAKFICSKCPVKEPCLDYAIQFPTNDMHGVWAGKTRRELQQEQRRRGVQATRPSIASQWAAIAGRNRKRENEGGS